MLSREQIDKRLAVLLKPGQFIGADVDKREREALETARQLGRWARLVLTVCPGSMDELGCAGCLYKTPCCPRLQLQSWLRGEGESA